MALQIFSSQLCGSSFLCCHSYKPHHMLKVFLEGLPCSQQLRLHTLTSGGTVSIPHWATKILHAALLGQSFSWALYWIPHLNYPIKLSISKRGFSDGSEGKESACNAGDTGTVVSIPGPGRSPGEGNGNPLQYSCLKNPMDRGAWQATVHEVMKNRPWLSE